MPCKRIIKQFFLFQIKISKIKPRRRTIGLFIHSLIHAFKPLSTNEFKSEELNFQYFKMDKHNIHCDIQ